MGTLLTLVSYLLLPHLVSGRRPAPPPAGGVQSLNTHLCRLLQSFARFYLSKSSKYEGGAADQLLTGKSPPPSLRPAPPPYLRPAPQPSNLQLIHSDNEPAYRSTHTLTQPVAG